MLCSTPAAVGHARAATHYLKLAALALPVSITLVGTTRLDPPGYIKRILRRFCPLGLNPTSITTRMQPLPQTPQLTAHSSSVSCMPLAMAQASPLEICRCKFILPMIRF